MKLLAAAVVCLAALPVWAVKTQHWKHTTPVDFAGGTLTNLVTTRGGELRLGRKLDLLLSPDQAPGAVQAMAQAPDGSIVLSTFPQNDLLRFKDGKTETLAHFDDQMVTAIAADEQNRIYVAVAGEKAAVLRIDKPGDKPKTIFERDSVFYIWTIHCAADALILGTGPQPVVIEVPAAGPPRDIATLSGMNVLSLVTADDQTLYAGTGGDGLIYRIDRRTGKTFLLYDAAEAEISALALDAQGRLLAGTGVETEAEAAPEAPEVNTSEGTGPATLPSGEPIPPRPPEDPSPPVNPIPADEVPEVEPAPTTEPASAMPFAKPAPNSSANASPGETSGNALYRIDTQGFVSELFRAPVVIYGIAQQDDTLLLATGNSGSVYQLRAGVEEAEVLTRTDAAQVSAILTGRDGKIYLGLSNQGQLATLSAGAAGEGTFISPVLDAGVASAFGKGHLSGQLPEGTSITFRTRSGNAAEPEQGGWSDWSAPVPARTFTPIASPAARYLQYQLVLATSDPAVSPVVDQVAIAYQKPNLPPRITSLAVAAANDPTSPGAQNITWEVADPNEDTLQYTVEARGTDKGGWVTLAKELTTPNFTWPARSAADGRYEIRVTASDASDNELGQAQQAQRTSDPFLNDHTPPTIGDFDTTARDGVVTVKFRAVDRLGTVSSAAYTVNRADGWQIILPDDTIADSPEERYMIALKGLSKGSHTLTVRVTDESGNASFEVVSVSMP